jgi:insertion element IS1 protein InsB
MWSLVQKKQQRWLWRAIDHPSGVVLAYVCGTHEDDVFLSLQILLQPFGISRFYTEHAGVYPRPLSLETHAIGKQHTQKIERKHLPLRTRIKRLARKTICFSPSIMRHDIVRGLFMNRDEFALPVSNPCQQIRDTTGSRVDTFMMSVATMSSLQWVCSRSSGTRFTPHRRSCTNLVQARVRSQPLRGATDGIKLGATSMPRKLRQASAPRPTLSRVPASA